MPVTKSITDKIVCDSEVEVRFAEFLEDARRRARCSSSCPEWFKSRRRSATTTPTGPSSARRPTATTSTSCARPRAPTIEKLQWEAEGWKIKFGEAHFEALKVDYFWGNDPKVLIEVSERSLVPAPVKTGTSP